MPVDKDAVVWTVNDVESTEPEKLASMLNALATRIEEEEQANRRRQAYRWMAFYLISAFGVGFFVAILLVGLYANPLRDIADQLRNVTIHVDK